MSDIVALSRKDHYKLAFVVFPIEMQVSKSALRLYRDRLHVDLDDGALSGEPQRKVEEFCPRMESASSIFSRYSGPRIPRSYIFGIKRSASTPYIRQSLETRSREWTWCMPSP